jgi:hypothetical protein
METSRRMAIHHECKVAAMTGEGVVPFGFTIYRGINKVGCLLSRIVKRVGINLSGEFRRQVRTSLLRRSGIPPSVKAFPASLG